MRKRLVGGPVLVGAVVGGVFGALGGLLYQRLEQQRQREGSPPPPRKALVRLGVSLLPALRQLLELLA
jgi:hypothetical protein